MAGDVFRCSGTAATSSDLVNGNVEDHWRFCTQRKYVLCDYLQGLLGSQRYYDPYPGPGGHVESHFDDKRSPGT